MSVSSFSTNSDYYDYYKIQNTKNNEKVEQSKFEFSEENFFAIMSNLGQMPPAPPQELDVENMADSELAKYLEQMQEFTGTVPSIDGNVSVESLSAEDLESIRSTLSEMSANSPHGAGKMHPPEQNISSLTDSELSSLLEIIQKYTGSIPGIEESEDLDISNLTAEQLNNARSILQEQQQEQFKNNIMMHMDEMIQNNGLAYATANYT